MYVFVYVCMYYRGSTQYRLCLLCDPCHVYVAKIDNNNNNNNNNNFQDCELIHENSEIFAPIYGSL